MNERKKSLLFVHLAVFFFGFPGVISKLLSFSPLQLTWIRVLLASLSLFIIIKWQKEFFFLPHFADLWLFLACGFLLAFHWTAFFQSVKVSTVAVGLLSYSTFPVFTIFLEPLLLRSRFKKVNLIFALVCVGGVSLMVPEFTLTNRVVLGIIWGILSGLSFSFLTIINRKLSLKYSSLILAFYQDTIAMFLLLPAIFWQKASFELNLRSLIWLLSLGIICTAGAHTLFIKGLEFIEAQTSSLISSLEPVYGIILGYLILKESPDLRTIMGGLVIMSSVLTVSLLTARQNKNSS
jgi:drug/metabolite transporter (DMT)-like permease